MVQGLRHPGGRLLGRYPTSEAVGEEGRTLPTSVLTRSSPPGELFSETNDNSVAILLTHGTARVLLAGDAEAREEYIANDCCARP